MTTEEQIDAVSRNIRTSARGVQRFRSALVRDIYLNEIRINRARLKRLNIVLRHKEY